MFSFLRVSAAPPLHSAILTRLGAVPDGAAPPPALRAIWGPPGLPNLSKQSTAADGGAWKGIQNIIQNSSRWRGYFFFFKDCFARCARESNNRLEPARTDTPALLEALLSTLPLLRNCDQMVAIVTKLGFSGRKKRDGLGRRGPRGAGVRDEFGKPTGRLVALRHGHRARRGPVAARLRRGRAAVAPVLLIRGGGADQQDRVTA